MPILQNLYITGKLERLVKNEESELAAFGEIAAFDVSHEMIIINNHNEGKNSLNFNKSRESTHSPICLLLQASIK